MFDKLRKKLSSLAIAALSSPDPAGELINATDRGAWEINDGVNYAYPIAVPANVRDAGDEVVEAYIAEASKQLQFQFATNYLQDEPFTMPTTDILREWDWTTRRSVLENSHMAWARNPIAKAAVRYNRLFAIGEGVQITYQNEAVREVVEEVIEHPDNKLKEQEKEWLETLQVDGELFFRKFVEDADGNEPGGVIITPLPAFGIQYIKHEPGFFRRVISYKYSIWESDGEGGGKYFNDNIPADEVHHVAINKLTYEQRGRPELFSVLTWLKAHKSLLENLSRNIYFTNVLYDVSLKNATAAGVSAKRSQYKEPPAGAAIAIHNDKEEWNVMTTARTGTGDNDTVRDVKMMVAAGTLTPEYMLGDGENANLASATAQQLPALRKFADFQDIMKDLVWKPIIRKWILEPAIESGDLPEEVEQQDSDGNPVKGSDGKTNMIKTVDAFDVRYPNVEQDDPKTLGEALQLEVMNERMSNETAAGIMPFEIDYQAEKKKIAAERQLELDEIRKGERPMPPNMMTGDEDEQESEDGNRSTGSEDEDDKEVS